MKYLNDCAGKFKCPLNDTAGKKTLATLLWGDPLHEVKREGQRVQVCARGQLGWVDAAFVGAEGERGLLDVLSGTLADDPEGRRRYPVQVAQFWHCGMARFADAPGLGAERTD